MFDETSGCYAPDWPLDIEKEPRLSIAKFGESYEQRALDGINWMQTKWKLKWTMRPRAVIEAMDAFLQDAQAGGFQFYDPSYRILRWVFCDEWTISWQHKGTLDEYGDLEAEFRNANGDGLLGAGASLYIPPEDVFQPVRFSCFGFATVSFIGASGGVSSAPFSMTGKALVTWVSQAGAIVGILDTDGSSTATFVGRGTGTGTLGATASRGTATFVSTAFVPGTGKLASAAAGAAAFVGRGEGAGSFSISGMTTAAFAGTSSGGSASPPVTQFTTQGAVAGTFTAAAFDPPANTRIIAFASAYRNGNIVSGEPQITSTVVSGTNPTWTKIGEAHSSNATAPDLWVTVHISSDLGSTPPTGLALTVSPVSNTLTGCTVSAISVLSSDVDGTVVQTATGEDLTAGDPTFSFAAPPAAGNIVIGHNWHGGSNSITPPTGYTELYDNSVITARRNETFYDVTSANQSGNQSISTNGRSVVVAIELGWANTVLASGRWNDAAPWDDIQPWKDGPSSPSYFIAPTGNDTTGTGSLSNPWRTLAKAHASTIPGDTVYMRGGTYANAARELLTSTFSGNSTLRKFYLAYPGETPVFDFSTATGGDNGSTGAGLVQRAAYITIRGLTCCFAPTEGFYVDNATANNNRFEYCIAHHNGRLSAFTGSGFYMELGPTFNTFYRCDSYLNKDSLGLGDNGDGFRILVQADGNVFQECRAWSNSDDGFDFQNPINNVVLGDSLVIDCWAWGNGFAADRSTLTGGDGNGFKMGGQRTVGQGNTTGRSGDNTFVRCVAWQNAANGFDDNQGTGQLKIYNCTAYDNKKLVSGYAQWAMPTSVAGNIAINCMSIGPGGVGDGGIDITNISFPTTNAWQIGTPIAAHFQSYSDTIATGPRGIDGSNPASNFLRPASGSIFTNVGTPVSFTFNGITTVLAYQGTRIDIGAFESVYVPALLELVA